MSLANLAYADRVRCTPVLSSRGKIVGYCLEVCNTLEDKCTEAGCIYDVHLSIRSNCTARKIRSMPKGWTGVISPDGLGIGFVTPPPTGGAAKPIRPGQCRRFCILTNCTTETCFKIRWWTTDEHGQVLDTGKTQCCPPVALPAP